MKLHLPIVLLTALLALISSVGSTLAYGAAEPVYEGQTTTGTSVANGETTWEPDESVTKVSYCDNIVTGYGNGVLEITPGSSATKTLNIIGFETVDFKNNTDTYNGGNGGGAILMDADGDATLNIANNTSVNFSNNRVSAEVPITSAGNVSGASIYMTGKSYLNITGNVDVTFSANESYSLNHQARGAAIYAGDYSGSPVVNISGNTGTVLFENNSSVSGGRNHAQGGAVYITSTADIILNNNAELSFKNNKVSNNGGAVSGAAICNGSTGKFEISGNVEVNFSGNVAVNTPNNTQALNSHTVHGGAIYSTNKNFSIVGNGNVSFTNNAVILGKPGTEKDTIDVSGGAIYARNGLNIQGNDMVTFSGNYERTEAGYRMRAIYGRSDSDFYFSANEGGKIEFCDAITLDKLNKNPNLHLNAEFNGEAQTGEIIMSGADVEKNLQAVKTAAGAGDVTAEEIELSRQFSVAGAVTLYAGTLILDEAVLAADSFILKSGSTFNLDIINPQETSLSLGSNCVFESNSNVILQITEQNVGALSSAANEVSILVANVEATTAEANISTVGDLGIQWEYESADFKWKVEDGKTWIVGTVNAVTDIVVDDAMDLSESITDVADGTKRSVTVVNTSATLSGDNTHTGGTAIDNADVTLGSASALGAGAVSSTGISSLTVADGVVAVLPGVIANKDGELTLNGTFDASALKPEVIGATYLGKYQDEELKPGANGFYRHEGSSIQIVENNNASVSPSSNAVITHENGITYTLEGTDGMAVAHGETLWDTYHINTDDHTAKVSDVRELSDFRLELMDMESGTLIADESVKVKATGGKIALTGKDVALDSELRGETAVNATGTGTISGDNSHTGDTTIIGSDAKLTVGSETALGDSTVYLREHGALDLGGFALDNAIHVEGCTVSGASQYEGEMTVSGDLQLTDDIARAAWVTLTESGSLKGNTLETRGFELLGGNRTIATNLTILEDGAIVLHAGNALTITGNLTIGKGVCITLADGGYAEGDALLTWTGTLTGNVADMLLEAEGDFLLEQDGKTIKLALPQTPEEDKPVVDPGEEDKPIVGPDAPAAPMFDQAPADVLAQSNWGIFTASRAFTAAVQGQRNNMGCIANGRGTAWASLLGGMTDISGSGVASGSDITLFGAAVGVDMKLGKRSSLGVAFGYTDGEVSADGLGDIDQESGHIALYGEHGLKKFAADSCLSLDWVAATGTTESKYMGTKWEQDSVQLNARLSWNKQVTERFSYNVFGGLEYFASESDRVQNCKSGSVQNLRGELGIGVRYVAQGTSRSIVDEKIGMVNAVPGCERVVLYGEVSYINDMVRNNPSIEVNGLRGSGANPGRQGVGVEAGATIRLGERWSANANYSFNAMDDSNEHILNIGASRTF